MNKIIITPLGTISPYPKNNMNCPGFLVEYNNHKILLDCGNGTTRLLNMENDLKNFIIKIISVILVHFNMHHSYIITLVYLITK